MTTTFHLNVNELTVEVLNSIKTAFKDKTVDITIAESNPMDETEYLLATEANREHLKEAMSHIKEGKGITYTMDEFLKEFGNESNNI